MILKELSIAVQQLVSIKFCTLFFSRSNTLCNLLVSSRRYFLYCRFYQNYRSSAKHIAIMTTQFCSNIIAILLADMCFKESDITFCRLYLLFIFVSVSKGKHTTLLRPMISVTRHFNSLHTITLAFKLFQTLATKRWITVSATSL